MGYKFIDLFAGIGGFHIAFHNCGCECVFASEIDEYARQTYEANFKGISPQLFLDNNFNENILNINPEDIPPFDILCAGFPCQPFSQAGQKKGFLEERQDRGNMFFVLRDIIKQCRPKAVFLENVQHLLKHDDGKTFAVIKDTITNELNYKMYYQVCKASDYGLPQHRPRLYIVCFRKEDYYPASFQFPSAVPLKLTMSDIFQAPCEKKIGYTLRVGGRGSKYGDRRNWEFYIVDGKIRRLTSKEGRKMMGFPENFKFPVSEIQAMKQLGNSVAVSAIEAVANVIVEYLNTKDKKLELVPNYIKGEFLFEVANG